MSTKIIANYLPQYHRIPENDAWWGEGYTDWVAVKNSKPLYAGHNQPRVPLNDNYYSLDDVNEIRKQAKLAVGNGIYGFGIYHYWFSSQLHLLDKPAILLRDNKDISIHYMFIWDNASWKRTWSNVDFANEWAPLYENQENGAQKRGMLAELEYGDEADWRNHFDYLLPFFKDDRYIKIDGKPVFAFYNQNNNADLLKKMCALWNELALQNGFSGIVVLGKLNNKNISFADIDFTYEPEWSGWLWHNFFERVKNKIHTKKYQILKHPVMYDYDKIWKKILRNAKKSGKKNTLYGCFVAYDDTPRRGLKGKVVKKSTPGKFEKYLTQLIEISNKQNKEFTFVTAWNEWGEGAYLEPDESNKMEYLQAVKNAIDKSNL